MKAIDFGLAASAVAQQLVDHRLQRHYVFNPEYSHDEQDERGQLIKRELFRHFNRQHCDCVRVNAGRSGERHATGQHLRISRDDWPLCSLEFISERLDGTVRHGW